MNRGLSPGQLLSALTEWLNPVLGSPEDRSVASLVIEKIFGLNRGHISATNRLEISEATIPLINHMLRRLLSHEPVQYILEEAFFYDRFFDVNPSVLIPRSETEELCRMIIEENTSGNLRVLDIGTGSGCIAIILALWMKNPEVDGWDISQDILNTAIRNARKHQVGVKFGLKDIFESVGSMDPYDIIVSNPPYVTFRESPAIRKNVLDFEPHTAIFAGDEDPLRFYRRILQCVNQLLKKDGKIYFEINEAYGPSLIRLLEEYQVREIKLIQDIHGKDRFIKGIR